MLPGHNCLWCMGHAGIYCAFLWLTLIDMGSKLIKDNSSNVVGLWIWHYLDDYDATIRPTF